MLTPHYSHPIRVFFKCCCSARATAISSSIRVESYKLALEQTKAKLLKQALAVDEMQMQHQEQLIEMQARHNLELSVMGDALRESEEAIAVVTAAAVQAEKVKDARIATLLQQLNGGCWLDVVADAKQKAASAEADQRKVKELMALQQIGPRMRTKGGELLSHMSSKAAVAAAGLEAELAALPPLHAEDVGCTERWVDGLAAYIEQQIFFAGKGEVARTKLVATAVFQRSAMQRLLQKQDARTQRLQRAMVAMIDSAHGVLGHLTPGGRGSRSREDQMRFEAILAALIPDGAPDLDLVRAISELLGVDHKQIERALQHRRTANADGTAGAFSRATSIAHKRRNDYPALGDVWPSITGTRRHASTPT